MKFPLQTFATLLAGAECVVGIIRTEKLLSDGSVHVIFSNFTDTNVILNQFEAVSPRQRPDAFKLVECSGAKTYWDHWWYGAGPVLVCRKGQKCSIAKGEGLTIGWSVSGGGGGGGGGMDLTRLRGFAYGLSGSHTWSGSVTTSVRENLNWKGPSESRLWLKQWFSVTEATCRSCYGSNPGAPGYYCTGWNFNRGWIPCKDWDCYGYSVSDAYARCDAGNHCQLNP